MARVLHRLGVDFRAFVEEHDQDVSRSACGAPLSQGECLAIEKFLSHGQIRRLAKELGCSVGSAQSRVTSFALEAPDLRRQQPPRSSTTDAIPRT